MELRTVLTMLTLSQDVKVQKPIYRRVIVCVCFFLDVIRVCECLEDGGGALGSVGELPAGAAEFRAGVGASVDGE